MSDIAVIVGSFNPPHLGHFNLASKVLEKYHNIHQVIFVPVGNHYEKDDLQDAEYRFQMLKVYCDTDSRLFVSRVEFESQNQLYTHETLGVIQKEYPWSTLYLVIGSDNLYQFDTWKKYKSILTNHRVIVFARDDSDLQSFVLKSATLSKYASSFSYIEDESFYGVNSTVIRTLLKNGSDVSALISSEVYNFIKGNNKYI